jgi:hypothetical protein
METQLSSGEVNNSVKTKIKMLAGHIGKIGIIVVAISIGFFSGEIYYKSKDIKSEKLPMDLKVVHSLKETSIAINERDELLIIDRKAGNYEIYDPAVGKVVFRLYASQMAIKALK